MKERGGRLLRSLWIAQYLIKYRSITPRVAMDALGISFRTYNRCIAGLRLSGMNLISCRFAKATPSLFPTLKRPLGGVEYLGFDPDMAPVRREEVA